MTNERGNAMIGIVVIIIVLLVGGIFFWNNYKMEAAKNAELKRQAEITQTQIIHEPTITETATSTQSMLRLDIGSKGKVSNVEVGQMIEVSLGNPGDGGYEFDRPEYDTSILHLENHVHNPPTQVVPGNFGTDAWQFTAIKAGATDLTITASRPFGPENKIIVFKTTFSVK